MMKRVLFFLLIAIPCIGQTVNPNQIRPSATNGQVLTTVSGNTAWAAATGGSGTTIKVNGSNTSDQTTLNFVNPATFNGIVFTFSNPTGGNITFTLSGALNLGTGVSGVLLPANGGTGVADTDQTLGSSNINWASLGTGIVKNTTSTGAKSVAVAADVYGLWSGGCSSANFLRGDGACASLTTAWSSITNPAGNLALTMAANTTALTYNAATGSSDLFSLTDTSSNSGTGILAHFHTAPSSSEIPWQADSNGHGCKVAADGSFQCFGLGFPIGSGTASNTDLNGKLTLSGGTQTYSFTSTGITTAPICVATDTTAANAVKVATSTTTLTLTGTGTDVINYICMGLN